jgi:integrase/recombinase XerD
MEKGCFFMLLKDAKDEFLFDCQCRHLAKGTLRNYRCEITFLIEYLEVKGITEVEQVKPTHIRNFLKSKEDAGCTPQYINDLLKAHKTWFNYLQQEDYIDEKGNAAAKVKAIKQPKVIIETFTEKEVKQLVGYYSGADYLNVRNKTMIALLFDTGMRCNEMIMMEAEDIAPDYIIVRHGKGNKERIVPKSAFLGKQLMRYLRVREGYFAKKTLKHNNLFLSKTGKPLTDEAVARMLKRAGKAVGVNEKIRVSPHTCRHTFAQMQLKNGLDVYSLSRLMGHVNISITQRYLQGIRDRDIVTAGNKTSPLMNL